MTIEIVVLRRRCNRAGHSVLMVTVDKEEIDDKQ